MQLIVRSRTQPRGLGLATKRFGMRQRDSPRMGGTGTVHALAGLVGGGYGDAVVRCVECANLDLRTRTSCRNGAQRVALHTLRGIRDLRTAEGDREGAFSPELTRR